MCRIHIFDCFFEKRERKAQNCVLTAPKSFQHRKIGQKKYHILDVEKNQIDEKKRVIHKRRKKKVIKLITIQNHKKGQFFSKKVDNVNKIVENY